MKYLTYDAVATENERKKKKFASRTVETPATHSYDQI